MGRYYNGDIEGKFWFGVQSSDAADRFGDAQCESNYIQYWFNEDNFDLNSLEELLEEMNGEYDKAFTLNTDPNEIGGIEPDENLADLQIGLKIYQCIKEKGSCSFEAEC